MLSHTAKRWRSALQVKSFRNKIIITSILLGACAFSASIVFQYAQHREGLLLNDYLLNRLPVLNLSAWIFTVLYILLVVSVLSLLTKPNLFLTALQAYVILTIFRFITILLTPLEPPSGILILYDPFVQHLFYQQTVTKDLFFSGHTSILILMAFVVPGLYLRVTLIIGATAVAVMLLLQHVHYTVDILAAPLFAWLAFLLAKKTSKEVFQHPD